MVITSLEALTTIMKVNKNDVKTKIIGIHISTSISTSTSTNEGRSTSIRFGRK